MKNVLIIIILFPIFLTGQVMDTTQKVNNEITFENLLNYLENLPQEDSTFKSFETRDEKIPDNWLCIGTLADKRIGGSSVMYKPWTNYAIGFYPFFGCDVYKDDQGKIILSYIELGGHFPFRRNFYITKKSPIKMEPVSISVTIKEEDQDLFLKYLMNFGVTKEKIENDQIKYKSVDQITEDLNVEETIIFRTFFYNYTKTYYYSIITKRENAVKIKTEFKN
jgi:hypothetical protein